MTSTAGRPDGSTAADDRGRLEARLRRQARSATELGSPLYALLFDHVADDVAAGGACWAVLRPFVREPDGSALPLRLAAAVHRLVLRREAPALALHYPSVGGTADPSGAWPAFRDLVEARRDDLIELCARPCQTNEVGRSAALGPAFLTLARRTGLPLHHLEIGASAGLNLRWDAFCYGTDADVAAGRTSWGDVGAPVDLRGHWTDPPPDVLAPAVTVVGRAGCDPRPIDPTTADGRETLTASLWPDQPQRHQRLRGALDLATRIPARVDAAAAGEWLAEALATRPAAVLTIVSHSVVWRYIPLAEQARITALLADAGRRSSAQRPLAWVRLEPRPPMTTYAGVPYPVTVTTWPDGDTTEVAEAAAHGQQVRWLAGIR